MLEAAAYLLTRSAANRLRLLSRKARSPRYLIALVVGIGYLALVFLGQHRGGSGEIVVPAIQVAGTLLLLGMVAKWWLLGTDRMALAFSPAEIQFLFPAPVSRTQLLWFKLLRAQLPILLNVTIWVVILNRGRGSPLPVVAYAVSLWAIFMLIMLHRLGVALTRDSVAEHGVAGVRRQWLSIVGGLLLTATVVYGVKVLLELRADDPDGDLFELMSIMMGQRPLVWILFPFQLPFRLLSAPDLAGWATAFLPVIGLIAFHLVWVLRADRAFEEAAIAASARRAELLHRWRRQGVGAAPVRGAGRRSLPLGHSGHPIFAIVWKNLTRLARTSSAAAFVLLVGLAAAVVGFLLTEGDAFPQAADVIGVLSLGWLAVLTLLGPQWVRNDLRGDLEHIDELRTWPLPGHSIVLAEVLSSGLVLTAMQGLLAVVGLTAFASHNTIGLPTGVLLGLSLPGLLVLTAINLLALLFQNAAALLYPAWVRTEIRPGGVEAMGQHILTAGASLLLLLLALLGPTGLGAAAAYAGYPYLGWWSLGPGMLLALAGIALEFGLLLDWLGQRFERFDPSTER